MIGVGVLIIIGVSSMGGSFGTTDSDTDPNRGTVTDPNTGAQYDTSVGFNDPVALAAANNLWSLAVATYGQVLLGTLWCGCITRCRIGGS